LLHAGFLLAHSSALKIEATCSYQTSVDFQQKIKLFIISTVRTLEPLIPWAMMLLSDWKQVSILLCWTLQKSVSFKILLYVGKTVTNRQRRSMRLSDVKGPIFSRQSAHRWRWGCQPYALAALYPQEDFWHSFLLEAELTAGP
jgi:hypothetical protein